MNRDHIIHELELWIEDEPDETSAPFIDLDGKNYSLQDLLVEVENNTEIGQAFVNCYDDVMTGVI